MLYFHPWLTKSPVYSEILNAFLFRVHAFMGLKFCFSNTYLALYICFQLPFCTKAMPFSITYFPQNHCRTHT